MCKFEFNSHSRDRCRAIMNTSTGKREDITCLQFARTSGSHPRFQARLHPHGKSLHPPPRITLPIPASGQRLEKKQFLPLRTQLVKEKEKSKIAAYPTPISQLYVYSGKQPAKRVSNTADNRSCNKPRRADRLLTITFVCQLNTRYLIATHETDVVRS